MKSPILLNNPLNVDGMMKKVEELNTEQDEQCRLDENELKLFAGVAKGMHQVFRSRAHLGITRVVRKSRVFSFENNNQQFLIGIPKVKKIPITKPF